MSKSADYRTRQVKKMLSGWGHICVICGNPFRDNHCITVDHVIPRSKGGLNDVDNKAPAHWRCNQLKRDMSLLAAARLITEKRVDVLRSSGEKGWVNWLNSPEPSRRKQRQRAAQFVKMDQTSRDFRKAG